LSWSRNGKATVLEDAARKVLRPNIELQQALVILLDARSVLRDIKVRFISKLSGLSLLEVVSITPPNSRERREMNPRLPGRHMFCQFQRNFSPGYAKRLRRVGEAGPIVAAAITGTEKELNVSSLYGGLGEEKTSKVKSLQMSWLTET